MYLSVYQSVCLFPNSSEMAASIKLYIQSPWGEDNFRLKQMCKAVHEQPQKNRLEFTDTTLATSIYTSSFT